MYKKLLSVGLVTLLVGFVAVAPAYAGSREEKQARFTEKVLRAMYRTERRSAGCYHQHE